jgi:hypothetical protein
LRRDPTGKGCVVERTAVASHERGRVSVVRLRTITGAGVGWLVGQSLAALVAIRTLRKEVVPKPVSAAEATDLVTHGSPELL